MKNYMGCLVKQIKNEEEEETPTETPNGDDEGTPNGNEDEANEEEATNEEETEDAQETQEDETQVDDAEEKASSDDDVVTGHIAEKDEEDGPKTVANEDGGVDEDSPKIEETATSNEETAFEERNETSTGDSGVDEAHDEEQVLS